jgi:hypothetical protein
MNHLEKQINKMDIVTDNPNFEKLAQNLSWFESVPSVSVNVYEVTSRVEKITGKWDVKVHNCITIQFPCNSYVRIASYGKNSVEITNINVKKSSRNQGTGSMLMFTLIHFIMNTLGTIPNIFLECTGNLEVDGFNFKHSIQDQTRFFRKFGFRVYSKKGYPDYALMKLDHSKLNLAQIALRLYTYNSVA